MFLGTGLEEFYLWLFPSCRAYFGSGIALNLCEDMRISSSSFSFGSRWSGIIQAFCFLPWVWGFHQKSEAWALKNKYSWPQKIYYDRSMEEVYVKPGNQCKCNPPSSTWCNHKGLGISGLLSLLGKSLHVQASWMLTTLWYWSKIAAMVPHKHVQVKWHGPLPWHLEKLSSWFIQAS